MTSKNLKYERITTEIEEIVSDFHKRGVHPTRWQVEKRRKDYHYLYFDEYIRQTYEEIITELGYEFK